MNIYHIKTGHIADGASPKKLALSSLQVWHWFGVLGRINHQSTTDAEKLH